MICHNYPDFGVWGGIWGILPEAANAAPEFIGSLDHVLQEKHLLQSPWGRACLQSAFGLYTVCDIEFHYRISFSSRFSFVAFLRLLIDMGIFICAFFSIFCIE